MTTISFCLLLLAGSAQEVSHVPKGLDDIRAYLKISERLSTAGQIEYDQIPLLKEEGFDVVVNLAPARRERNLEEGFRVTEAGMTYVQIPVDWRNPSLRDLQLFFDVMKANIGRKVFVHCFANMRVSAFVYLYRTLVSGEDEIAASQDLRKIWDPATEAQWKDLIEKAKSEYPF